MTDSANAIFDPAGLRALPGLFFARPGDAPHQTRGKRLLQVLGLLTLAGLVAGGIALAKGHHVMGTTSESSWGVLIATYVFLVASTTGLCLVSSLGHVFGFELFEPIAKKAMFLALVMLLAGFAVIATELERPFLLLKWAVLSPNPSAPIWWMGTLYGVYTVLILVELHYLFDDDHRKARVAGLVGVIAAVAAQSNLGAVFGLSHSRPYWYGPLVPIYFIALSLVCGAALLILIVTLGDYFANDRQLRPENAPLVEALRKLLALFVAILVFFTVWRTISGVAGKQPHTLEVTLASLTGPLFVSFWVFEVLLGMLVPLVLLLGPWRSSWRAVALAAFLPMLSVFVMRYNFVVSGQMFSLKPVVGPAGERLTYSPPFKGNLAGFLPYTPSWVEVLVVAGAIAGATLIFVAGQRALRLAKEA
ncbi:MAG: polysulfide reductase NrfD [Myxococcales bacterium]|nr:polysulfide reductase NrfD [Myxococcales bacterium]